MKRDAPGRQVQMWSGFNAWEFVTRPLWTIHQYPEGERIEECGQRRQNDSNQDYKNRVPKELNVGNATSPVQPIFFSLDGYVTLCCSLSLRILQCDHTPSGELDGMPRNHGVI